MDSVFNDHVFPKNKDQQVMKPQMHGFNDPTLRNFTLLDSSAPMKDELKADRFDMSSLVPSSMPPRSLQPPGGERPTGQACMWYWNIPTQFR